MAGGSNTPVVYVGEHARIVAEFAAGLSCEWRSWVSAIRSQWR